MIIVNNATGHFTITNLIGYNLINHTGKFIDKAPNEYNFIKQEYVKKRDFNLQYKGNQCFTIYEIEDTLKNKLNMNTIELSHTLKTLSYKLIVSHPVEYFRSVWTAFKSSFIVPSFESGEKTFILFFSRFSIPFFQILLGFGMIFGIIISFIKKKSVHLLLICLVIINLLSSIFFDCAENSRYFIYSYFIILIFVFIGIKTIVEYLTPNNNS